MRTYKHTVYNKVVSLTLVEYKKKSYITKDDHDMASSGVHHFNIMHILGTYYKLLYGERNYS